MIDERLKCSDEERERSGGRRITEICCKEGRVLGGCRAKQHVSKEASK
jgi:hypothetical protein